MYKVSVLLLAGLVSSVPVRRQAKLDQAATAQAQQFDATATRAFTATEIKVGLSLSPRSSISWYDLDSPRLLTANAGRLTLLEVILGNTLMPHTSRYSHPNV
jgi:hypothetical protein